MRLHFNPCGLLLRRSQSPFARLERRSNFSLTRKSPKNFVFGDPNGIRTRVTAVKGQCPNRWTIGSGKRELSSAAKGSLASSNLKEYSLSSKPPSLSSRTHAIFSGPLGRCSFRLSHFIRQPSSGPYPFPYAERNPTPAVTSSKGSFFYRLRRWRRSVGGQCHLLV